jgi:hypothetical protein
VTVCSDRGLLVPVARLFVASPSDPAELGPVMSKAVNDMVRRPARVGEYGPDDDVAGRIVLSLIGKFGRSERCLPIPVEVDSVGERWRYTIVGSWPSVRWIIEEPGTLMLWSGSHMEFDKRCATFSSVFW